MNISDFVDKLIHEKGFPDLTDEVRGELKKDLMVRVDNFLTAKIIASLSNEDVLTFENMLKEGKGEAEIQEFVTNHIPNFTNFLADALLEFKGVYLGVLQPPPSA